MNVRECYELINGDYEDVKRRFLTDGRIKRFALLFLGDGSMDDLRAAMRAGECEKAFRASHTLKGVCLNLGFSGFGATVNQMTELLRAGEFEKATHYMEEMERGYTETYDRLKELEES